MADAPAPSDLDVYDVAFLTGGRARVVDTAVVGLVRARRLRVPATGRLVTAELTRRHPVEAAILDAVGPTGHRSVDTICWRVRDDARLAAVGTRLRAAGLLRRTAPTRAGRRVLRALAERPPDTDEARVALSGRGAMLDARLRAEIFEPPVTSLRPPRPYGWSRDVDHSDPRLAAYRTGGTAAAAGTFGAIGDAW